MKTIAVDSTTLRTVGYDAERKLLQIEFQNRSIYQYFEVPATLYEELMQASSKGAYFNRSIRPRFDFALVKAASLS
jgi:KTSC domain